MVTWQSGIWEMEIRLDGFLGVEPRKLCSVVHHDVGKMAPAPLLTVKGKAVPLQAWSGPEDSRRLRLPDFVTTAHEGGKVVSLMHRPPLPPGKFPGTHFC